MLWLPHLLCSPSFKAVLPYLTFLLPHKRLARSQVNFAKPQDKQYCKYKSNLLSSKSIQAGSPGPVGQPPASEFLLVPQPMLQRTPIAHAVCKIYCRSNFSVRGGLKQPQTEGKREWRPSPAAAPLIFINSKIFPFSRITAHF